MSWIIKFYSRTQIPSSCFKELVLSLSHLFYWGLEFFFAFTFQKAKTQKTTLLLLRQTGLLDQPSEPTTPIVKMISRSMARVLLWMFFMGLVGIQFNPCAAQSPLVKSQLPNPTHVRKSRIKLFPIEKTAGITLPPIATLTYFNSSDLPLKQLHRRVVEIVAANPWLNSSFDIGGFIEFYEKKSGVPVKQDLKNNDAASTHLPHDLYQVIYQNVSLKSSYNEIIKLYEPFLIPSGLKQVNQRYPLFRVTFFVDQQQKRSAMLVQLSHIIADGHTFYSIYNMMDLSQSNVKKLNVVRKFDKYEQILDRTGQEEAKLILGGGFVRKMIQQNLLERIGRRPSVQAHMVSINNTEVESQKKQFKGNSYVTTNDIITSWFMKFSLADIATMAVNFRNRIEGIYNEDAGNYEHIIMYNGLKDFGTPDLIRASLKNYKRVGTSHLPTGKEVRQAKFSAVTNWSGFVNHFHYGSAKMIQHVPIVLPKDVPFDGELIIYSPAPGKLNALTFTRGINVDALKAQKLLSTVRD